MWVNDLGTKGQFTTMFRLDFYDVLVIQRLVFLFFPELEKTWTHPSTFCMQLLLFSFSSIPGVYCVDSYFYVEGFFCCFFYPFTFGKKVLNERIHVWKIWVTTVIPFECHVHLNISSFSSAPCFLISSCPLYKINHFGLTAIVPSETGFSALARGVSV